MICTGKRMALGMLLATCIAVIVSGCAKKSAESSQFPRNETLYIGGFQFGEPATFNPLSDLSGWPTGGSFNIMYETLLAFNSLTGEMEPLLAQSYATTHDKVTVVMNPQARWNDGTPLAGDDVAFTFQLGRDYKNVHMSYVWDYISAIDVAESKDGGGDTVTFTIHPERKNPLGVLDVLQAERIVPKHVFQALLDSVGGDVGELLKLKMDRNPVVSGPYNLFSYSGEKIVLKREENYWGNAALKAGRQPAPKYFIHLIYKSNDHYSIAVQQGRIDVSGTFIPRIWLKAKEGVRTWFDDEPFFIPAGIPVLLLNHNRPPLNDVSMRRAMAFAINYDDIRELAVSRYSPELKPGHILPFGMEVKYFSAEDAAKHGAFFDPDSARAILAAAGYQPEWDKEGKLVKVLDKDGAVVPTMFIKSPVGWTDWEAAVRIAVKSMRAVGIDVRERFVDAAVYYQGLPKADFDIMMTLPTNSALPSMPWARFDAVMTSRNWRPEGERMNKNQGRYNNPNGPGYNRAVDSLLNLIPNLRDEVKIKEAYRALNVIFMREQPVIPLVYRPEQFYEFSVKHWDNFPTSENPYAPPQNLCYGAGIRALWEIKPKGAR